MPACTRDVARFRHSSHTQCALYLVYMTADDILNSKHKQVWAVFFLQFRTLLFRQMLGIRDGASKIILYRMDDITFMTEHFLTELSQTVTRGSDVEDHLSMTRIGGTTWQLHRVDSKLEGEGLDGQTCREWQSSLDIPTETQREQLQYYHEHFNTSSCNRRQYRYEDDE